MTDEQGSEHVATNETTGETVEGSWSPKRPPTAAEQRAARHDATTDTEVLVTDIEKTREELAETLDAIVDRVSPKKVAERTKVQAREGVQEAVEIVKETAATAAAVVKEKAGTATEVVKEKAGTATLAAKGTAASVRERVSGGSDSSASRSPLAPATSVAIGSASPVGSPAGTGTTPATPPSPLPQGTVSIDTGELPPAEPADSPGSLADAAEASPSTVEPAGADLPAPRVSRPLASSAAYEPSTVPVFAGAGAAAAVAVVLFLLRRRAR